MRGTDAELLDLLGPDPLGVEAEDVAENLVDAAPTSRPMGEASRALLERSRSYPVNRAAKKNTPERLSRILNYASEMPVGATVALRAGISYSTLKYWLQKSFEGAPGDGFDIAMGDDDENGTEDNTIRFHEAWDLAMMAGVEKVEAATMQRAIGYLEPLTYQGRVQYQYDPAKLALARELGVPEFVPENYLTDEFGAPVPETVNKMDPDLAMFILKARKPQVYGAKASLDVNVKGGVLVVGMKAQTPEDLNVIEQQYRQNGLPSVVFEEGEEEET